MTFDDYFASLKLAQCSVKRYNLMNKAWKAATANDATTFEDFFKSLILDDCSDSLYNLMVEAWNAAKCAPDANENALTRSDDAASMQNKAANSAAIRAQEDLPDLKILRDHGDGYLYVWEKVRTQWKMKARYRTWTDVLNSLMEPK